MTGGRSARAHWYVGHAEVAVPWCTGGAVLAFARVPEGIQGKPVSSFADFAPHDAGDAVVRLDIRVLRDPSSRVWRRPRMCFAETSSACSRDQPMFGPPHRGAEI